MTRILVGLVFATVLLLVAGIFVSAQTNETIPESDVTTDSVSTSNSVDLRDKFGEEVSDWVYDYIYNFVKQAGINPDDVVSVNVVDFNSLPSEVSFGSVNSDNIAIYEVAFNQNGTLKKIYAVTFSLDKLDSQSDVVPGFERQLLNFGLSGRIIKSGFLNTATDVQTNFEKGYVMMRDGSITAMSTSLVSNKEGKDVEIVIFINGEQVGFGNLLSMESIGVKKDYDTISRGTIHFNAGDVISAYLRTQDSVALADVTTLVEITTGQ